MKTLAFSLLVIAAGAALLPACRAEEEISTTSGIEGQALIGPICPVVQEGSPCPDQPYQATIAVWNAERSEKVRTFDTDAEGRFRVALAPGEYYIEPQSPNPGAPPTGVPQTVTVPVSRYVQITIEYDSGIR